jgi:hypothetical protein
MLFGDGSRDKHPRVITMRPQVAISDSELRARVQWGNQKSGHFSLTFDRISFSESQASTLLSTLEAAYSQIFHFTHESFADRCPVYAIDQRSAGLLDRRACSAVRCIRTSTARSKRFIWSRHRGIQQAATS